ncbi:hypothetical protein BST96_05810 [Oceanicoccus sagamiensis]|uniref:Uncharacterized protein n=2 Tax=Oceanicoccus sagamiensis TaxID=716816 RepID=A0A1X9NCN7_9GAMM|nr:hypothetical protein BST96_05810 [Oceanicoccus sagamiensis]
MLVPALGFSETQPSLVIAQSDKESIPYSWFDACQQKITGSSQHILKKIFSDLNINLRVAAKTITGPDSIKDIVKAAEQGKLDFIYGVGGGDLSYLGLTANSVPAVIFERGLIYSAELGVANSLSDFSHKKGILIGTTKQSMPRSIAKVLKPYALDLEVYTSLDKALEQLSNQQVDYVIDNRYSIKLAAIKHGIKDNFNYLTLEALQTAVYIAVPIGSAKEKYFPLIDKKITQMRTTGYEEHIHSRYLNLWSEVGNCDTTLN